MDQPDSETRINELQAEGTRLVNESRMWKRRYEAAKNLLDHVLSDAPMLERLFEVKEGATLAEDITLFTSSVKEVHDRIDTLEKDAWCITTGLVREFVKEAKAGGDDAHKFLDQWVTRFEEYVDG